MKLKIAFASATALLVGGAALAGSDNEAYLTQSGDFNSAQITQSGNNNDAGRNDQKINQTRGGTNVSPGLQNLLTITQSGDNNKVGLGATNTNEFGVAGINQSYTYNGGPATYSGKNIIDITQTSNNNTVGSVYQQSQNEASQNSLTVIQGGTGNNTIGSVSQRRGHTTANNISVEQNGSYNTIARIQQNNSVIDNNTPKRPNVIDVKMGGSNNGNGAWSAGRGAAAAGAISSALIQGDNAALSSGNSNVQGNTIRLDISGTDNQFGVSQVRGDAPGKPNRAHGNSVGIVTITGNYNELGVFQQGSDNTLSLGTIAGNENIVGVKQIGGGNVASINISDDRNGGFHDFGAGVAGTLALAKGLTPGLLEQRGTFNQVNLTVSGSNNVFASLQDNSLHAAATQNVITATQNGNSNQAAIVQQGNNNTTVASQIGSSNNLAVAQ